MTLLRAVGGTLHDLEFLFNQRFKGQYSVFRASLFSLLCAEWRLEIGTFRLEHVHCVIFLFNGQLEFTHSAICFLGGPCHSEKPSEVSFTK